MTLTSIRAIRCGKTVPPWFACLFILVAADRLQATTILYSVDFSGPEHVVGESPMLGSGPVPRTGPTFVGRPGGSKFSGAVTVSNGFGPLTDRPLLLEAVDTVDGDTFFDGVAMTFRLDDLTLLRPTDWLLVAGMDVVIDDISGSEGLGLFIDLPSFLGIGFERTGAITVRLPGDDLVVGEYVPGELTHVDFRFYRAAQTWSVLIDGTQVYAVSAIGSNPRQMRVVLVSSSANPARAYVDNIRIVAVPEPRLCRKCALGS